MLRIAPALPAIVVALLLATAAPVAQRVPKTPADSLGVVIEPLFAAAKYDSILGLLPAWIARAESRRDSVLLGRAITQRGRVTLMLGRRAQAETDLDLGIRIAEAARDTVGLMPAVHFKGFAYSSAGDHEQAMRWFERRLFLALRTRSKPDEAWARSSMGFVFHRRGDNARAREEYTRAIALFRESGLERLEITPLIGLGRVESAVGNEPAAIRCYQRAWAVSRRVGDRMNEMWATNNLGVLEGSRGDLTRAAEYERRAFELARELKFPGGMVIPAINVSGRAIELGDYESAEAILRETRELCETQGAEEFLSSVELALAHLRIEQGRDRSAAAILRPLVASPERLDSQHRDYAVLALAQVLARSDSVAVAIELLTRQLQLPVGEIYGDAVSPANALLSSLYARTGDRERALVHAVRARESAQQAGRTRYVVAGMLRESICLRALGRNEGATAVFAAALDSLETFRGGISSAEWREVFGQQVADEVVEAGRVLLEHPPSRSAAAREEVFFDAMQRVRTRTLLDRITEPRFGAEDVEGRWSRRIATRRDLQAVLGPGELVLDFSVGRNASFLTAVGADSTRLVELPGPRSLLAERIELFRSIIASPDPSMREAYPVDRIATIQRALGREVLGGVADMIASASRVFVAADGFFAAIPFATLIVEAEGGAMVGRRDVIQVPSASVLVLQRSSGGAACVSDPRVVAIASGEERLSGARDEVRDLGRRYGGVEESVSLTNISSFERATERCDVLHIAAHALVVDRSPWESGIRLAAAPAPIDTPAAPRGAARDDRSRILSTADSLLVAQTFRSDPYVRAWQIAQLRLPARLAVLSACETAGGRVTSGEGTLGITAAFLSAGVPVVVSSLWPIDDRVTARMMRHFYRHLSRGAAVATALRLAQLELEGSRDYAHPFYWAGFTVVGDGSMVVEIEERRSGSRAALFAGLAVVALVVAAAAARRRRASPSVG